MDVPETRELALFIGMLEERGATCLPCPLVAIHDAPDPAPVEAWLRRFIATRTLCSAGGARKQLIAKP